MPATPDRDDEMVLARVSERGLLAALGAASSMADTAREAAALAQPALVGGIVVRAYDRQPAWFLAPWMLIRADRLGEVATTVHEALDHSRATGSQLGFRLMSGALRAQGPLDRTPR